MRKGFAGVAALVSAAALSAVPAFGAPQSTTGEIFTVTCPGIGTVQAVGAGNSPVAFLDGRVVVAKAIAGTFTGTLRVAGVAQPITFTEQFTEGVSGNANGLQGRLVTCTFTVTFTDTFTLDRRAIEEFGLPENLIGREATFTGTTTGTARVLVPGRK